MLNSAARIAASLGLAMAFAVAMADAQDRPVRVRGVIERVEGDIYFVKAREGNELKLTLADNATVSAVVKASLADVKANSYVGIASLPPA